MTSQAPVSQEPVYISKPHPGSWGQEYRIYPDRIELRAKILFTTLKIKLDNIEEIAVKDSKIVWHDMVRHPINFWWTYNNDGGGNKHIFLRQSGWPSRIRFSPQDPELFAAKCKELCGQKVI